MIELLADALFVGLYVYALGAPRHSTLARYFG